MVKGAVCDAPGSVCPAGTYCALGANGASSTCQPQVRENEECNGPEACVPGYVCIRQPSGKRLCGKLPGTGGRCFREQLPSCDSTNDYCDGQKCTRRNGPDAGCAGDDQCLAFTLCARGVCTPRGGRDAGCEAGTECLGPLECVNGRCAPPPAPPACP
jgi:hypothetical protein